MKQKTSTYQILRRVFQLASFIIIPGLFVDTFHAVQSLVVLLMEGQASWQSAARPIWTLFATIPTTILFGRYFCGWMCSFGAIQDFLHWISEKTIRKGHMLHGKGEKSGDTGRVIKYLKYLVLLFLIVFVWFGSIELEKISPWTAFGQLISPENWSRLREILGIDCLVLLGVLIGSFFIERFFCRYLCPMGAIYGIISKLHLTKIRRRDMECGKCTLCTQSCSMGIDLRGKERISSAECIHCMKCRDVCPRKNLSVGRKMPEFIPITVLLITIGFSQWRIANLPEASTSLSAEEIAVLETGRYEDGIYTGSARGYRGETSVTVTVENGNIVSIQVDETDDDEKYMDLAKEIITEVLKTQSLDHDAISGATLSSYGILCASRNALPKLDADELVPETAGTYTDGTYIGYAQAFRGEIEVEVSVENGNISKLRVISYYDDEQYLDQAIDHVIPRIIESQDLSVDAVAGATYSSNGIILAAADALGISEDELTLTEGAELAELHGQHGHRVKKYK